jgi:hypothetical protein
MNIFNPAQKFLDKIFPIVLRWGANHINNGRKEGEGRKGIYSGAKIPK